MKFNEKRWAGECRKDNKEKKEYLRTANPTNTDHIHHNPFKEKMRTDRLKKRMNRKKEKQMKSIRGLGVFFFMIFNKRDQRMFESCPVNYLFCVTYPLIFVCQISY